MDEKQQNSTVIPELDNLVAEIKKPEETDGFWLADFIREKNANLASLNDNMIKDNRKKVTTFLENLGLDEYLEEFQKKNETGKAYWFYNDEKEIITKILDTCKDNEYWCIRTKKYKNLAITERTAWADEIMLMFVRRGKKNIDLAKRMKKPLEKLFENSATANENNNFIKQLVEALVKTYEIAQERRKITQMLSNETMQTIKETRFNDFDNFDKYEELVLQAYQAYIETVMLMYAKLYATNEYQNNVLRYFGIEVQNNSITKDI